MDTNVKSHKINISWYFVLTNKGRSLTSWPELITFWPDRNMIIDGKDCYSFGSIYKETDCYKCMVELVNSVDENIMKHVKNEDTYASFITTNTELVEKIKTLGEEMKWGNHVMFIYNDPDLNRY